MNCVIPGRGIRGTWLGVACACVLRKINITVAFGKAIQCLAKIGEELYIEALADGVSG